MKLIFKIIGILILCIILSAFATNSFASFSINSADLYSKGDSGDFLKYNGYTVAASFIVYNKNGIEYPAYCMQKDRNGIEESGSYTVNIDQVLSNAMVWRAITNGYPYLTPEQLGCQSKEEAFTATKQAIYCILYGNDENQFERYSPIGQAGERVLNAMKNIVNQARNGTEVKPSSDITMIEQEKEWTIDPNKKDYVYKTFKINANAPVSEYKVLIEGEVPEGCILSDEKDQLKEVFESKEHFKISIPITNLTKEGSILIKISGGIRTKPIFYGKAPNSSLQDYALTGTELEDGIGQIQVNYIPNKTELILIKQDANTKKLLQGAEFNLMDENKNIIHSNLVSNEIGEIRLANLLPGNYYLQETKAPGNYHVKEEWIPITLKLNESLKIVVENSQETETTINTIHSVMNVQEQKQTTNLKLPKTGM